MIYINMFDSHVHTTFSTDSKMKIEDAIKSASKKDLGIIITEHLDLNFMTPGKYDFDIDKYFKQYDKYKSDKLLLGIEMGMRPDCIDENREIANKYPFDFVIGSVHVVEYMNNYLDVYTGEFYECRDKYDCYKNYLEYMLQCVKSYDFINSLGHIDYLCRYVPYEDKHIYYEEFKPIIDEILKEIINKDIAFEINTRRFNSSEAIKKLIPIYKAYKKLGGKIVTLGSDSHREDSIGGNFKEALNFARECKLQPVYFKNKKPIYMDK